MKKFKEMGAIQKIFTIFVSLVILFAVSSILIVAFAKREVKVTYKLTTSGRSVVQEDKLAYAGSYDKGLYNFMDVGGSATTESVAMAEDVEYEKDDDDYYIDEDNGYQVAMQYYKENGTANRKLIKHVTATAETQHYEEFMDDIEFMIGERSGIIYNTSIDNREEEDYKHELHQVRSTWMEIRVPADNLEDLLNSLDNENGAIIYRRDDITDVTKEYTNTELHKEALEAQYRKVLALLDMADDVQDLIAIQEKLSELENQLNYDNKTIAELDDQIEYSTLYLTVYEVDYYTGTREEYRSELLEQWCMILEDIVYTIPVLLLIIIFMLLGFGMLMVVITAALKVKRKPQELILRNVQEEENK